MSTYRDGDLPIIQSHGMTPHKGITSIYFQSQLGTSRRNIIRIAQYNIAMEKVTIARCAQATKHGSRRVERNQEKGTLSNGALFLFLCHILHGCQVVKECLVAWFGAFYLTDDEK